MQEGVYFPGRWMQTERVHTNGACLSARIVGDGMDSAHGLHLPYTPDGRDYCGPCSRSSNILTPADVQSRILALLALIVVPTSKHIHYDELHSKVSESRTLRPNENCWRCGLQGEGVVVSCGV